MELTRHQSFLVVLRDKEGRFVKQIAKSEALDLAIEAAKNAQRKDGQYTEVYAQVGVCR